MTQMVKSTDCSSRGPEFNSQQPHVGSQPSVMGSDAQKQQQMTTTNTPFNDNLILMASIPLSKGQ